MGSKREMELETTKCLFCGLHMDLPVDVFPVFKYLFKCLTCIAASCFTFCCGLDSQIAAKKAGTRIVMSKLQHWLP